MQARKPDWLKVRRPGDGRWGAVHRALGEGGLHTVCEEARCPNRAECWGAGTATLRSGRRSYPRLRFLPVTRNPRPPDPEEAQRWCVASSSRLTTSLTSVLRDDLRRRRVGVRARHRRVRSLPRRPRVEVLVPIWRARRSRRYRYRAGAQRRDGPPAHDSVRTRGAATSAAGDTGQRGGSTPDWHQVVPPAGSGETLDEVRETAHDLRRAGRCPALGQTCVRRARARRSRAGGAGEFDALREEWSGDGFAAIVATPRARTSHMRGTATGDRPGGGTSQGEGRGPRAPRC